jgi:hypothetical protein
MEINRDELGRILPGQPPLNPEGRPKDTLETKLLRKTAKVIIEEYKQALAEALPMIQPVLIAKAIDGDIQAIKEIHDRSMDKAKQATDITSGGEKILILPAELINKNNRDGLQTSTTNDII